MASRTVLLDGDIPAFSFAASAEEPIDWGDGVWTLHSHEGPTIARLDGFIESIADKLEADRVVVAISDKENFRYDVLPTYKHNRKTTRSPLLRQRLKDYMLEEYDSFIRPKLEGDDVLGILATSEKIIKGERIVVTIDKDLATIPGTHYRWSHEPFYGTEVEVGDERTRVVSPGEADYWWLYQTLTGDTTDGYKGCPTVGPKKAEKILAPFWGQEEIDLPAAWNTVVETYAKQKLGEEEALTQARVARILRNSDYDFKRKEPILWTPPVADD